MTKKKANTTEESTFEAKAVDLKKVKADKSGFKSVTTTFDSEFLKFEKEGDVFIGEFAEVLQAGKKGEEKPCALFKEQKTNKSYLIGNKQVMDAVNLYGKKMYRITFLGKKKGKKFTYSNFDIAVK